MSDRSAVRRLRQAARSALARTVYRYGPAEMVRFLARKGVGSGSTVMVHASWLPDNGFDGSAMDFVRALQMAVSSQGLLVMPSMTYQNMSTGEFLRRGDVVDLRKAPSRMGILSEVFRRAGARRSCSAAHPLLAWGDDADTFVADHEATEFSTGPGSPFERLLQRDGLLLLVDAPFSTITFTHFLEHHLLGEEMYEPEAIAAAVLDQAGNRIEIPTRVISREANAARREERLIAVLEARGDVRRARLGRTRFTILKARAMSDAVDGMMRDGTSFFDPPFAPKGDRLRAGSAP